MIWTEEANIKSDNNDWPSKDQAVTAIYCNIKNGDVNYLNIYSKKFGKGTVKQQYPYFSRWVL